MSVEAITMEETKPRRYRITVDQYHRMGETGILPEEARVELLDGEILEMSSIGVRHAECVNRLTEVFAPLSGRARLSVQNPIALSDDGEPVPDFVLVRRQAGGYPTAHPAPKDTHLIVEVFDATARKDRARKSRRYADRGVREYWVVDLLTDTIEVCRSPRGERWGDVHLAPRGEAIAPLDFPDFAVTVDAILPPPPDPAAHIPSRS